MMEMTVMGLSITLSSIPYLIPLFILLLLPHSSAIIRTRIYQPPELFESNSLHPSEMRDIYAVGVIMYQLMVGPIPWSDESISEASRLEFASSYPHSFSVSSQNAKTPRSAPTPS